MKRLILILALALPTAALAEDRWTLVQYRDRGQPPFFEGGYPDLRP